MRHPLAIDHLLQAHLAQLPQIEVVLQQLAQQLGAHALQVLLQLEVLKTCRPLTEEEVPDL